MPNNIAILTQAHAAVAAKKRARRDQIKEIVFDEHARRDFLTGFHKRKLEKTNAARQRAIQREKQERQETRREHRRMLRERAKENAAEVEKAYGAIPVDIDSDGDEWFGISSEAKGKQREEEYQDEEVLATVTVVEDFDPDSIIHGPPPSTSHPSRPVEPTATTTRVARDNIPSKKGKKVRYETKAERLVEQRRQRARRTEKAELAGGKASRKKVSKKGARR